MNKETDEKGNAPSFGSLMPGRTYSSNTYKYGFNGMEKDDEIVGSGNIYTAEYWEYDARLGRRWNPDPVKKAWESPYATFSNNPIILTDIYGLSATDENDGVDILGTNVGSSQTSAYETDADGNIIGSFNAYGPAPKYNESKVGNYLVGMIQGLPQAPDNYQSPDVWSSTGVKPTYENSTLYANCEGNCYTTSLGRVNKAYSDVYNTTALDVTFNKNGTVTTYDYQLASTQSQTSNSPYYGYGVGGALANKGLGQVVADADLWTGLKAGAQVQIWYNNEGRVGGSGHSVIFEKYGSDDVGTYMQVLDNHGVPRRFYQGEYTYKGVNLRDVTTGQ